MMSKKLLGDVQLGHILTPVYSGWWFGTFFMFPYIGNVIIPTDELIIIRGVLGFMFNTIVLLLAPHI